LAFTAAWVEWRRVKNAKRQKDMIFRTQFLTDEPEVVRRQILSGIDALKLHMGVNGTKKSAPVVESDQRAISAQVQLVQNEMTKLKKMISMKNQRRKTVQESTSIVKTSESVTADSSDKN